MKMNVAISLITLLLLSGCGSIHVFETQHIHVYPDKQIVTGDTQLSGIARFIKTIQNNQPQEEKLDGFNWNDEMVARYAAQQEAEDEKGQWK